MRAKHGIQLGDDSTDGVFWIRYDPENNNVTLHGHTEDWAFSQTLRVPLRVFLRKLRITLRDCRHVFEEVQGATVWRLGHGSAQFSGRPR